MHETSLSLLVQIRQSSDHQAWDRLMGLYAPLLGMWLRKYEVQPSDADDIVQEVLMAVARDLKNFEPGGEPGAFRAWLRAILVNRLRGFWRARGRRPQAGGDSDIERKLQQLEDPASALSQVWNREHDQHVARQLLALVEPHFAPTTWRAFCRVALEGVRADVVASELGMSLNAVFIAKSRVLSRLRQEAGGLIDSASGFLTDH